MGGTHSASSAELAPSGYGGGAALAAAAAAAAANEAAAADEDDEVCPRVSRRCALVTPHPQVHSALADMLCTSLERRTQPCAGGRGRHRRLSSRAEGPAEARGGGVGGRTDVLAGMGGEFAGCGWLFVHCYIVIYLYVSCYRFVYIFIYRGTIMLSILFILIRSYFG